MSRRLRKILRKNEIYRSYRIVLKRTPALADFDSFVSEMELLHKQKKTRTLMLSKKMSPDKLIDAGSQSMSYRSRIVEMKVATQKAQRTLASVIDNLEAEIIANYVEYINERSIAGKKAYVKSFLSEGYKQLSDLNRIVDMADVFIQDIDQSAWALKHMMDGLTLIYTRENIVGSKKL